LIKSKFSIKDLENLTGIKAHTIRIWEKRYNLLQPDRTDTNIRTYDLDALQKILNISYLRNIELNFTGVFYNLFIPFLEELGFLWQSKTINPAHEHFISNLIKQKILVNLEKLQYKQHYNQDQVYILFLPENEMHDLGLLFLNYELLRKGCKTIYLGASIMLDYLPFFKNKDVSPIFITYITVQPTEKQLPSFLKQFERKVSKGDETELWVLGHRAQKIKEQDLLSNQKVFKNISEVIEQIPNGLKKV